MSKNFIIFMGPQGSGKSTQAKLLAQKLGYQFISSGEVLRDLKQKNDPLNAELEKYWLNGQLVPNELMYQILFPVFRDPDVPGFVIDGFPRELVQVNALIDFLEGIRANLSHVFYLKVSYEECINRIKGRILELNRPDETEEAIKTRLDIYYKQTEPLLLEYKKMGRLYEIDGEQSIENIHADVMTHFTHLINV